jgi:hypothetical protein
MRSARPNTLRAANRRGRYSLWTGDAGTALFAAACLDEDALPTTEDELARGTAAPAALTEGFVNAFWAGAVIAFAGVLASIFLVRERDLRLRLTVVSEPAVAEPTLEKAA